MVTIAFHIRTHITQYIPKLLLTLFTLFCWFVCLYAVEASYPNPWGIGKCGYGSNINTGNNLHRSGRFKKKG